MSWPLVNLSTVCQIDMGSAPKGSTYVELDRGVPLIAGAADYGDVFPRPKKATIEPTKLCKKGDIIICVRATIGDLNWADKEYCLGRGVAGLRANDEKLDSKYLWYFIASIEDELYRNSTGSTFPQINKKVIESLKIPLPPLETQKQIAEVLEKSDQLRKDCQQMEGELNSLAQSVFIDMFGDPVTNPKGWDVKPISSLLSQPLQNGAYYPKEDYSDAGVEMVHMGDVFYDFIPRGGMKRVNASQEDIEKYKLTSNDLLISRRSLMLEGAAKPSLIEESNEDLIFESSMIRLTPNNKIINVMYLFYYLNNPIVKQNYIYQYITGATIKGINQSNLSKVEVLVPDYKLQESFLRIEQKIRNQKNKLSNLVTEYEANFNALMQKAFKGELNL
ncbi:restriction endonuclease subunit S [Vibrio alginolyticus]|nr:restriction endonuclease subunit S [Vibrio alginolyticus]